MMSTGSRSIRNAVARALSFVLSGVMIGAPTATGYYRMQDSSQPAGPKSQEMLHAEAACDQAISRLHSTLDFRVVCDEFWVTDPALRDSCLRLCFKGMPVQAPYDPKLARQLATSTMNVLYLLVHHDVDHPDRPLELQDRLNALDASQTRIRSPQQSSARATAEVKRSIREASRAADFLRRHLARDYFTSDTYKRMAEREIALGKNHGFPKVLTGTRRFGLGEDTPVYEIFREGLSWDFIEENGQYRLLDVRLQFMSMGYL
jgi:hypothetical protein